jgi:hypothetical protein
MVHFTWPFMKKKEESLGRFEIALVPTKEDVAKSKLYKEISERKFGVYKGNLSLTSEEIAEYTRECMAVSGGLMSIDSVTERLDTQERILSQGDSIHLEELFIEMFKDYSERRRDSDNDRSKRACDKRAFRLIKHYAKEDRGFITHYWRMYREIRKGLF